MRRENHSLEKIRRYGPAYFKTHIPENNDLQTKSAHKSLLWHDEKGKKKPIGFT